MSSYTSISPDKLARLIGTAKTPALIDVRTDEDFAADPRLIPGAVRRNHQRGRRLGRGILSAVRPLSSACTARSSPRVPRRWLRHARRLRRGARRRLRGLEGRQASSGSAAKLPPRDAQGRTVWVTRARPKIDRIACPWLIRRFVDPNAVFLFVAPPEVDSRRRALQRRALRHRKRVLEPSRRALHLRRHGRGVRSRDRAAAAARDHGARGRHRRGSISSPEAPGLLAASLGLSRMYDDDLEQLEAGMALYDAFYRWCRDATDETHNWPTNKAKP